MAPPRKPIPKVTCTVCRHAERRRIEMLRLAGSTADHLAETFDLSRDSIYRHMAKHVPPDLKAALIADVPLRELAERAAAEGTSLLDHLHIVRSTVIGQMLGAASVSDRTGTAALAGRAVDILREIGRLTGELLSAAPVQNVTNHFTAIMASPAFDRLERMLLERLAPHPAALAAVLDGLDELQGVSATPIVTLPPAEGFHATAA